MKSAKANIIILIIGIVFLLGGAGCITAGIIIPAKQGPTIVFPEIPTVSEGETDKVYSVLTGEEIDNADLNSGPVYCIQTPNGTDGARPQVGLRQAKVIFEAIAEAGITRFAAIYQNPTSAVIGPIRSLRIYYLDWDTPFDCTIVHAGGADDAIAAVRAGKYKDLNENYTYMYRGSVAARRWNNLFTTSANLARMNIDWSYGGSNPKGFIRMTPEEAEKARIDTLVKNPLDITSPTDSDTSLLVSKVPRVGLRFGYSTSYNVSYTYNIETNSYDRGYMSGAAHEVYKCPGEDLGEKNPEEVCTLSVLSPKVVIAMVVAEGKAADNYHESIRTTGTGKAYVFQNGTVTVGTWSKPTRNDQISFLDEEGKDIELVPGQTFISAVPEYGVVEY